MLEENHKHQQIYECIECTDSVKDGEFMASYATLCLIRIFLYFTLLFVCPSEHAVAVHLEK
jgi:hypothetical protein